MSSGNAALMANQRAVTGKVPSLGNTPKPKDGYFNLPKVSGASLGASASGGLSRLRFTS